MKNCLRNLMVTLLCITLLASRQSLTEELTEISTLSVHGDSQGFPIHDSPATADGYFGRAHGDTDGIPPDGEIRINSEGSGN